MGFQAKREYSIDKGDSAYSVAAIKANLSEKNFFIKRKMTIEAIEESRAVRAAGARGDLENR